MPASPEDINKTIEQITNNPLLVYIPILGGISFIVLLLVILIVFIMWSLAVVDLLKSDFKKDSDKLVWAVSLLLLPPIATIYFFIAPKQKSK